MTKTEIRKSFEEFAKSEKECASRRKVAFFFSEKELEVGYTMQENNISVSCIFGGYGYLSCWYALKTEKGCVKFDVRGVENFPLVEYYLLQRRHTHVKLLRFVHSFLSRNPRVLCKINAVAVWTEIAALYLACQIRILTQTSNPKKLPKILHFRRNIVFM